MYDKKTIATAFKITMYLYKLHVLLWQIFDNEFRQYRKLRQLQNRARQKHPDADPFLPMAKGALIADTIEQPSQIDTVDHLRLAATQII
jgi:hypothetical protein